VALTGYLLDTSVMHRLATPEVGERVEELGVLRPLYRCAIVDLEVLRSATSSKDYDARRAALVSGFTELPMTHEVMTRALGAQRQLASRSQHRGVSLADLTIAAYADVNHAAVLHYDADYDLIAEVTGQPTEWVVSAGSVA
jgi:predicted nucleic acid-binding protein